MRTPALAGQHLQQRWPAHVLPSVAAPSGPVTCPASMPESLLHSEGTLGMGGVDITAVVSMNTSSALSVIPLDETNPWIPSCGDLSVPTTFQGHTPQRSKELPPGCNSCRFQALPSASPWGPSPQYTGLQETFDIQTMRQSTVCAFLSVLLLLFPS